MSDSDSISDDSNFGLISDDDHDESSDEADRETGTDSESENDGDSKRSIDSTPLTKELVEFNKLVISMRPLFKQARIQFINNTTRQIKKIKTKKGTEAQVEKNKRKSERMAQEIAYINRLKKDVVAKFALLHSKEELKKIIISPDSTMEYRVKAKVASIPAILNAAEKYHADHPDWVEKLFKLIQLVGKDKKRKRRKMRGKGRTKKNTNSVMDDRVSSGITKKKEQNNSAENDDSSSRFHESNFPAPPAMLEESCKVEPNNPLDGSIGEYEFEESSFTKTHKKMGQSIEKNSIAKRLLPTDKVVANKRQKLTEDKQHLRKDPKKEVVSKPDLPTQASQPKKSLPVNLKPKVKASVDPFFRTTDDKEYKTYCKVEPADSAKPAKDAKVSFKNLTPFADLKKGVKKSKNGFEHKPQADRKSGPLKFNKAKPPSEMKPEQLHPSWQAKKKLHIVTAPFQGKKIVFDD